MNLYYIKYLIFTKITILKCNVKYMKKLILILVVMNLVLKILQLLMKNKFVIHQNI